MTEFEKWCENPDVRYWLIDYGPFDAAKAGWRAALEWMRLIHDESYDIPEKGIYVGDIMGDKFEKELKNGQS